MTRLDGRAAATAAVLWAGLAGLWGCAEPEADVMPSAPPSVVFEGKVAPDLVGAWKTDDGRSGLELGKDGTLKVLLVAATPGGDSKSTYVGEWRVHSDNLLLRYRTGEQDATVRYPFHRAADVMTLTQGQMKTVYRRK